MNQPTDTTPDFLIAITNPNARIVREGYESRVPRTADELADHYHKSNVWQITNVTAFMIQAVAVGTVFLRIPNTNTTFFSRGGVLYLFVFFFRLDVLSSNPLSSFSSAILFAGLSSMAEIPTLFAHRPVILRHQKAAMYHPFVEAAGMTLVDIPITVATLTAYSILVEQRAPHSPPSPNQCHSICLPPAMAVPRQLHRAQ